MATPHRYRVATLRPGPPPGGPKRARAILASLAAVGVAAGGVTMAAAHYGAGLPGGSDAGSNPNRADASAAWPRAAVRAPGLRLAYGGDGPFVAFLKGLFGVQKGRDPRGSRRPEQRLPQRRSLPPAAPAVAAMPAPGGSETGALPAVETYRTVCVRLCDGYYWPVSFATPRDAFKRDTRICTQSCNASTALYYYPNPGGEVDDMVNLDGQPYKGLGTAFLYRSAYDANCKCRPHPWEAGAAERHKSYTEPAQTRAAASRGGRRGP
jgi:hypothetical protein